MHTLALLRSVAFRLLADSPPPSHDVNGAWVRLKEMAHAGLRQLPLVGVAVVVFVAFYFAAKGVRAIVRKVSQKYRKAHSAAIVFGRLAQATIVIVGLMVALVIAVPSIKAGDVIGFLGISSVAIGFAFRDILQNFLAGILLLATEPFKIGDQIRVHDFEGSVQEIQTRATLIKTYDGRRIVIPNSDLFTNAITVNTAFPIRRLQYDFGIGFGDDIGRAKQLMLEAMKGVEGVLDDPAPDVIVVDLAESSVSLRARWWINPPRQLNALDQLDSVLTAIKNKLQENGIDLPYPTRQVLFHDQTEETDGDRSRQREGWPAGRGDVPKPRSIGAVAAALRKLGEGRAAQGPENGREWKPRSESPASDAPAKRENPA